MKTDLKFYISYFYNIRFFKKDLIPVSTAISDPSWFKSKDGEPWLDSRGVLCGLNFPELSHPLNFNCGCPCKTKDYQKCSFLRTYRSYLSSLDFDKLLEKFSLLANYLRSQGKNVSGFCLMVYEKPDNPCSERKPLQELWKNNGLELLEYDKDI